MSKNHIEISDSFKRALDLMEKGEKPVFVTGRAGTGKSTLLSYFRDHTKKNIVVLAPTGVASLNVQGQTIHSFFGFSTNVTLETIERPRKNIKTMRALDSLVIDEISMVRADLLDCVDRALRLARNKKDIPFGGAQLIGIGDLYQLPPVVASAEERQFFKTRYESPYFFSSDVFRILDAEMIELEKIYRQSDEVFIDILNAVRNNSVSNEHLQKLNARCDAQYVPDPESFCVTLTTTNAMATEKNREQLNRLPDKEHRYDAEIGGSFERGSYPTDESLLLKKGAQVMMVANDRLRRWVNGSIGRIESIRQERGGDDVVVVRLQNGKRVDVECYTWEMFRFSYDPSERAIVPEATGYFRQYPLTLAWAVTIHKSQGKTFEKVVVDVGRGTFAHGQMYVALSRATTLEGLTLKRPVEKRHIFMDFSVVRFLTEFQYKASRQSLSLEDRVRLLRDAVREGLGIDMTYLKSNDEKSRRTIYPRRVAKMVYMNKEFLGVDADDEKSGERRVFRVDRILEMRKVAR